MMISLPHTLLFFYMLFAASFLTLMATDWVFIWVGLELNLMCMIPLLVNSFHLNESESTIKYFIMQAIGGGLLLLVGLAMFYYPLSIFSSKFIFLLLLSSLLLKLGAAPFHFWFPQVMSGITWPMCMLLSTWQKIPPFMILLFLINYNDSWLLSLIALMGVWIGGMGGMNQTQLRPLLAYSSIAHLGWMLLAMYISSSIAMFYLGIYIIINISLMLTMYFNDKLSNSGTMHLKKLTKPDKLMMSINLLSLGGIPPMLGFFPKMMVCYLGINLNLFIMVLVMVLGSLLSLFYYLNLLFNSFLSNSLTAYNFMPINSMTMLLTLFATCPLPLIIFML
nr:NADH dehydrogenase subunit 2 [Bhawania goodei]